MDPRQRHLTALVALFFIGAEIIGVINLFTPPYDRHHSEKLTFMAKLVADGRELGRDEAKWIFSCPRKLWGRDVLPIAQEFFPGLSERAVGQQFWNHLILRIPKDAPNPQLKVGPSKFGDNPRYLASVDKVKDHLINRRDISYGDAWWYRNPVYVVRGVIEDTFQGDPDPLVRALFSGSVLWSR